MVIKTCVKGEQTSTDWRLITLLCVLGKTKHNSHPNEKPGYTANIQDSLWPFISDHSKDVILQPMLNTLKDMSVPEAEYFVVCSAI